MRTLPALLALLIAISAVNARPCHLKGICYALDNSRSISAAEYEQIKKSTLTSSVKFAVSGEPTEHSAS